MHFLSFQSNTNDAPKDELRFQSSSHEELLGMTLLIHKEYASSRKKEIYGPEKVTLTEERLGLEKESLKALKAYYMINSTEE